jgi:hypothetical protein
MIEVKGPADLAVGDQVEVREYDRTGTGDRKRGVVEKVGKLHATVAYQGGQTFRVHYARKETYRVFRRRETRIFRPISKLTARDVWLEQCPKSLRVWGDGVGPTLIVGKVAARDELESTIRDLRAHSMWLNDEPKEGA